MALRAETKLDRGEAFYPLSGMQQGMLFHALRSSEKGIDVTQVIMDWPEKLEPALINQAWQKLAERHEVLRTSFRWEGLAEPRQEVQPTIRIPVAQKDWEG